MINYTNIKNNKTNTANIKSNLIDKTVFECLNCNEVSLYSDTAQMTVFYFQKLFVKTNEMWTAADLMKNIDEIY